MPRIQKALYIFCTIYAFIFFLIITETSVHEYINTNHTNTSVLISKLKIKPTRFAEWKQRHYMTGYFNKDRKVRIYVTIVTEGEWYLRDDFPRLKYKHDETLTNCDIPCVWKVKRLNDLTPEELKNADAFFCVNQPSLPKEKAWKGQKYIQYTLEPKTHCPQCHDKNHIFDIRATYHESSDIPTSYVRMDSAEWRSVSPFNITKLPKNSPFISFIASHWTEFRESFISSIEAHIPVASFGGVRRNTDWRIYPECEGLSHFGTKNCLISKYPFYFAIENSQEKDYSTEKLWDAFNLGVVPVIWGASNTRSYLPDPKSAIFIEDFKDAKALADYLKYLVKNETAYLEYHKWRTTKLYEDEFEKKSYMSMYNVECNACREVARLRILEEYNNTEYDNTDR